MFTSLRAHALHIGLVVLGMVIVGVPAGAYIWHEQSHSHGHIAHAALFIATTTPATSTPAQIIVHATSTATTTTTSVSFEGAGTIKSVSVSSGANVTIGATLFTIGRTDLSSQLAAAKKTLADAQAALAKATSTPVAVSAADQEALTQAQNSVRTAVRNAYISSNNIVNNQAAGFFNTPKTPQASLAFSIPNSQLAINLVNQMQSISSTFTGWEKIVYASSFTTATDTAAFASQAESNLKPIPSFLNSLSTAVGEAISLSSSQKSSDQSTLSNGQITISNALSSIVSAELDEQSARAQIAADQSASISATVKTDQAAVSAAQAQVNSIEAEMMQLVKAPVSGVVAIKVKTGEAVSTSTVLATISSKK